MIQYEIQRVIAFSVALSATSDSCASWRTAIATFAVALVPSYSRIGITAPILLTSLRILQGLSVGGEIPGAITYVSESMPKRKGFACGIIFFSLIMGLVMGSLIQALLSLFFIQRSF